MLAQATGIYRERPAAGPLSDHFDCAWVHRLPASQTRTILVVPDGSIDLQWLGGALRIAGPDREPQTEALAPGAIVVGFRFRPGHAAAWLGLAATEMLNRRIPLDEIWGREASRLAEEVSAARGVADLVQRLERGLARRAAGRARAAALSRRPISFWPRARRPARRSSPGWQRSWRSASGHCGGASARPSATGRSPSSASSAFSASWRCCAAPGRARLPGWRRRSAMPIRPI